MLPGRDCHVCQAELILFQLIGIFGPDGKLVKLTGQDGRFPGCPYGKPPKLKTAETGKTGSAVFIFPLISSSGKETRR
ncbi:hypothetical protein YDYSY3_49910 [Paenibacillus chitinolyticus]|nr:hypothetical protein YDYSY3_49910 [Paenibacillus chitinolyticus]